MPTLASLLSNARAAGGLDSVGGLDDAGFGGGFGERRRRPRVNLLESSPAELENDLLERIRAAPPENVEDQGPSGALQYALEVLDLPRNAIANLVDNVFGLNAATGKRRAFGLRKISGHDILKSVGLNPSRATGAGAGGNVADFLSGFLADVALDPLTWLTGPAKLLGSAATKIGKTALKPGGVAAVEKRLGQAAEEAFARRGTEGAEAVRRGFSQLPETHPVITAPTWKPTGGSAGTPLTTRVGTAFDAGEGAKRVRELVAERVAKESPELVDPTLIGLSTRGMREFNPVDLPVLIGQGLTGLLGGPRAAGAVGRGYQKIRPALSTALNPIGRLLPEKDITLLTREQGARIAQRLGLDKFGAAVGGAVGKIPGAAAAGEAARQFGSGIGRGLWRMFETSPPPPRAGDIGDQQRYGAEALERSAYQTIERTGREKVFDEVEFFRTKTQEILDATGVPPEITLAAADPLAEGLRAVREGKMQRPDLAREIATKVEEAGGTAEQARKLVSFLEKPDISRRGAEAQRVAAAAPPPAPATPKIGELEKQLQAAEEAIKAHKKAAGWSRKTRQSVMRDDPAYVKLVEQSSAIRKELARAKTLYEFDRERASVLEAIERGEADPTLLHRVPLEKMPRAVQLAVRNEARRLLPETTSERTKRALEKVISGKDATGEGEAQKQRIYQMLTGEVDIRTQAERDAGFPQRPADPVIELYAKTPPIERRRRVREALAALDADQADELVDSVRTTLGRGDPTVAAPDEVRAVLEGLDPPDSHIQRQQLADAEAAAATARAEQKAAELRDNPPPDVSGMVAKILPDLPADAPPTAVRAALIEAFGGKAVDDVMAAGLRTERGLKEIEAAATAARRQAAGLDDPVNRARALLGGLGHEDLGDLPPIDWAGSPAKVTAADVDTLYANSPGLQEWMTKHLSPRRQREFTASEAADRIEALRTLTNRASEIAATPKGLSEFDILPGPRGAMQIHPKMQELIDHVAAKEAERLARYEALGVKQPRLSTERELGYLKRIVLGDPDTRLGQLNRKASMTLKSAAMQMRQADREALVSEINRELKAVNEYMSGKGARDARTIELAERLQLPTEKGGIGLKPGEPVPLYSDDIVLRHTARQIEAERVLGSAEFFHEMVRRYGVRVHRGENVPDGYTLANANKFGSIIREYAFRPEVARVIEQHVKLLEEPNAVLSAYRKVLGVWKGLALMAPGYHLNNLFGSVWNAKAAHAWTDEAFTLARQVQRAAAQTAEKGIGPAMHAKVAGIQRRQLGADADGAATLGEIYREAFSRGVTGGGLFAERFTASPMQAAELLEALRNPDRAGKAIAEAKKLNLLAVNRTVGTMVEDAGRLTVFISRLKAGDTAEQAADVVKKVMFNYNDITTLERGTPTRPGLRDVIPFWTWTRFNSRLLMRLALSNPRVLAQVPKMQIDLETVLAGEDALPDSMRPAHVYQEGGVQVSGGTKPQFFNLGRSLPVGELSLLNPLNVTGAANKLMESAAGPAKTAYELLTNRDTFFDRPIREYPGQTKEFLGFDMPPEAKHALRTIRPLNMAEQQLRQFESGSAGGAFGHATGLRLFPIDARRQVFEAEKKINEQVGAVRRDIRMRLAKVRESGGDPTADADLQRLLGTHAELQERRAGLPGQAARAMTRGVSAERRKALEQLIEGYRQQQGQMQNAE